MKSVNSILDIDKLVKKSISDLSKKAEKMWEWLTTKPDDAIDKNTVKSQFRKNFQDIHLEMAFLRINDILPYSYKFSTKKLYDVFNAQTVHPFLNQLLCVNDKPHTYAVFTDDFRTVELARMMFELSSKYLQNLTTSQMIQDDLNRVSEHFKIQAENKLKNETYATHGNTKDRKLTEHNEEKLLLEKQELINKYAHQNTDEEVQLLRKRYDELFIQKLKLKHQLPSKTRTKSQTSKIKNNVRHCQTKMDDIRQELQRIESDILQKIDDIEDILETKYDHMSTYFCPLRFLPEFLKFSIDHKFSIPEPDDDTPLVIMPAHGDFDSFSMPESDSPSDGIITDEIRKFYTGAPYLFRILENHEKIRWYGNEPSVSLINLRKYPPLNRFKPSWALSIVPMIED